MSVWTAAGEAARRAKASKKKFAFSHHREADFKQGLRIATLGLLPRQEAWRRLTSFASFPPFRPEEASTPHYHEVDFQMIFVPRPNSTARASILSKPEAVGFSRPA
jgi:hypothetical protein